MGPGRASPVSRRHYPNVPSPLRRGVLHGCTFRIFTASMGPSPLRHRARHSLAPPVSGRGLLTTRQASLDVTDRSVCTPRQSRVLDAGLRHRPFPDDTASPATGPPDSYPDRNLHRQATTSLRISRQTTYMINHQPFWTHWRAEMADRFTVWRESHRDRRCLKGEQPNVVS